MRNMRAARTPSVRVAAYASCALPAALLLSTGQRCLREGQGLFVPVSNLSKQSRTILERSSFWVSTAVRWTCTSSGWLSQLASSHLRRDGAPESSTSEPSRCSL